MGSLFGSGRASRRRNVCAVVLLTATLLASRAWADDMQFDNLLHGTGSAATIQFAGSTSTEDVYSDVLTWTDLSTGAANTLGATTLETYCVDVIGNINFNTPYNLNIDGPLVANAGHDSYLTTGVVEAISTLFAKYPSGLVTPGSPETNGGAGTVASDAEFQAALWAIIYDNSSLATATLSQFENTASPALPLMMTSSNTASVLSTAFTMAQTAWNAQGTGTPPNSLDVMIVNDPATEGDPNDQGQSQIYIGEPNSSTTTTPLPASFAGSLALFGLMGIVSRPRRAKNLPVC